MKKISYLMTTLVFCLFLGGFAFAHVILPDRSFSEVENRNLKDFSVDTENSKRLRNLIPGDVIFVSESGIKNAEDVKKLLKDVADRVYENSGIRIEPEVRIW